MAGTRRAVLGTIAGLLLAGLGYRAWERGVFAGENGPAYAPWKDWRGTPGEGPRRPLHAAILAANPHDTQPWLFRISEDRIVIMADRTRRLGSLDPFGREMQMGLGCAIENLAIAARAFGLGAKSVPVEGRLTAQPGDAPVTAALIELAPAAAPPTALFVAIPHRHTNRGPYRRDRAISPMRLRQFAQLVSSDDLRMAFVAEPGARHALGMLIVEATEQIIADPQMSADNARWFRAGRREIDKHRDGVTIATSGLSPAMIALAEMAPDVGARTADREWLAMTRDTQLGTAPVLGAILVRDRLDMVQAIEAGRAWQRLHLAATVAGLAAQPLNQPVEIADRDRVLGKPEPLATTLAKLAGMPGWDPIFVFRMGVPLRPAGLSPRRPLGAVVCA